jgi:uncharacterized protein YjbJ (UPF0337 family)
MQTSERTNQDTTSTAEWFTAQWPRLRQEVQGWWDQLTDADLEQVSGQKDRLMQAIAMRYGYARERAEQELNRRLHEWEEQSRTSRFSRVTEAATVVADSMGRAGEKIPELGSGMADLIRRYPLPSLVIGMGLGFLLGQTCRGMWAGKAQEWQGQQSEAGYPNALIQCTRCGQMIRQENMVEHSVTCRGSGILSHGGSTS